MKRFTSIILATFLCYSRIFGQNAPNLANSTPLSPESETVSKANSVPINLFTGIPQIGIPLYLYNNHDNGLSLNLSLEYLGGGMQVGQQTGRFGFGWVLNGLGMITRTVRGSADDIGYDVGYLYDAPIANDWRSSSEAYYNYSLDAEQDIFQYSFNGRSGKFVIGKNGQVVQMPLTKLRIIPSFAADHTISAFRIIAEDGTKYDFNNTESTTIVPSNGIMIDYYNKYSTGWSLTRIVNAFNTDTIKFNYTQSKLITGFNYPQFTFVRNSDGVRTKTLYDSGTDTSTVNEISSIILPNNLNILFSGTNGETLIKIKDSVLRSGYILDYQSYDSTGGYYCRNLLKSVTPYTATQKKLPYSFIYNTPAFPATGTPKDTIENKIDYWGYYNGANNGSNVIPSVNGYAWGANRNPNFAYAVRNSLEYFNLPDGGSIYYEYELNDHYPYTKDAHVFTISPAISYSTNITLSQVFKTSHQITFVLDSSISRVGSPPISGTGNMICNIKSTDGTITYKSDTISLYDLFYHGMKEWVFTIPNGSYKFEQLTAAGTTIIGGFTIYVKYENKLKDSLHLNDPAGGIRVKRVTKKYSENGNTAFVQEYQYVNTDGTSSGFLGDIPKYDYPYLETINYGGVTTTSYTNVSSNPLNTMSYAQGSPVGYSRVIVFNGTSSHNLGKTVYDFTSLQDVNANFATQVFPYVPEDLKDWGIGLPKSIAVYDSLGVLVKRTVNTYSYDSAFYINDNFKSLKLGNSYTYYNGSPTVPSSKIATYIGQEYYPVSGHVYLSSTYDTLFQTNGTKNTTYINYYYDTNYNVIKTVQAYAPTRGLTLENRLYYPYNYTITGPIKTFRDSGIISPVISRESWITGDANPRITGARITDYQSTNGYLKPLATYALQSNAPIQQSTIGTFNPALLIRNTNYFVKQNNFITYDSKGNLLQTQNAISGINNSEIMDYNKQFPIAKVRNAAYNDIAYTSFESDGTGNWIIAGSARDSLNAITGKKSYNLNNGNITKPGLTSTTNYLVTLWAKSGASVTINGITLSNILASQQGWNFYSQPVSSATTVTISGSGDIDELRLYPRDANMITSTYEPNVGITSTTDANNTIVYTEYDSLNRIKLIRDKDKNILKRYDYSDIVIPFNIQPIWTLSIGCEVGNNGLADSIYTDTNPYSDTYYTTKKTSFSDICDCYFPVPPDYKKVNGSCEEGVKCYTSSVYTKVVNPDGTYSYKWKCTYHYLWTDGSVSANYIEYNTSSCMLICGGLQ